MTLFHVQSRFSKLKAILPSRTGLLDEAGCLTAQMNAEIQPSERGFTYRCLNDAVCGPSLRIPAPRSYISSYTTSTNQAMRSQNTAVSVGILEKYFLFFSDSRFWRLQGRHLTFTVTLLEWECRWHQDVCLKCCCCCCCLNVDMNGKEMYKCTV